MGSGEFLYDDIKELIKENDEQNKISEAIWQWKSLQKYLFKRIKKSGIKTNIDQGMKLPYWGINSEIINYLIWFFHKFWKKIAIKKLQKIITNSYINKDEYAIINEDNFYDALEKIKIDYGNLKKYNEIQDRISILENNIKNINFEEALSAIKNNETYYINTIKNIKYYISKNNGTRKRVIKDIADNSKGINNYIKYKSQSKSYLNDFMKAFPVHFVTNLSIFNLPKYKYDYVIVDEAAQSDIQSTIGLLQMGKHNILCGDAKQLEPIYQIPKEKDNELARKHSIDSLYKAYDNSLLNIFSKFLSKERSSLLNEHYRCPEEVIKFSNAMFYSDELIIKSDKINNDDNITIIDVDGEVDRNKWVNRNEIRAIVNDIKINKDFPLDKIAIISPFRAQVEALKKIPELKDIAIDTIFKFQGKEYDKIYFSTVIGSRINFCGLEYANKKSLINVALTRAKEKFVLVTNVRQVQNKTKDSLIGKLQRYILDKEYKKNRANVGEVSKNWSNEISNFSVINKIKITNMYKAIKNIAKTNDLSMAINMRYIDVFYVNDSKYLYEHVDYVLYDKKGNPKLIIKNNKIIYKDSEIIAKINCNYEEDNNVSKKILTKNERWFKDILDGLLKPEEVIMPNVKLSSVINLENISNLSDWMLKSINGMHYDFVIYKEKDGILSPIKVIELDDETHKKDESIKRDNRKNWISSKANINLKRFISYKY